MNHHAAGGTVELRPYQTRALGQLRERLAAGARRIVLVAPTGAGKTTLAARAILDARSAGQRVLFLAHRRELIVQAYQRLVQMGVPTADVGILMGRDTRRRPGAGVQVASIDTLRQRARPRADVVIVDECHRALARTYTDLAAFYARAIHLGLTATPYRADGKGLRGAYDELLMVSTPKELMAEGHLVEPQVFTVPASKLPDLGQVGTRGGDYDGAALARAMNRATLVGNIVEHWLEHARDLRTVVFAASIDHSRHITDRFREVGIAAEHLDGTTPVTERDAILGRLERGETRVVASVGVLCEGWDQPSVKCAILARPTKSTGLYLQQAGRILRPWQGERAVILDHAGCALEHGLPQEDRAFSLDDPPKKRGAPPLRVCSQCSAIVPLSTRQCQCGAVLREDPLTGAVPAEALGQLEVVTQSPLTEQQAAWRELCTTASSCGYRPGWAYAKFRERFGRSVPRWFSTPGAVAPVDKHARLRALVAQESSSVWAALRYRIEFGESPPVPMEKEAGT